MFREGMAACGGVLLAVMTVGGAPLAQERQVPDTYTAVTTHMTPADVEIKADILQWSSDEERAAVVAALTEAEDPVAALQELPTLGVVWRSGSAVGHAIKYAVRETGANGSETITLVTDKRVGSTSFNAWTAEDGVATPPDYSVLVLSTGGDREGTMSLAAEVVIDAEANTVSLARGEGTPVLTNVTRQPPPYWARAD